MKNIKRYGLFLVSLFLLFIVNISCSSSSNELIPLKLGKKVIEVYPEGIASVDIISGEGSYEAIVGEESLLEAKIVDDKLILVGKKQTGDLNVVVRDGKGQLVGLYVILSEKEILLQVNGFENQVRIDDLKVKKEIEELLAKKEFPVEKSGGYKLIYRDENRGNLVVYDTQNPSELWKGSFELNQTTISMNYEKNGKKVELNYIIAPDLINPNPPGSTLIPEMKNLVLFEDWTSHYKEELNLPKLELAAKLQYVEVSILE